MDLKDRAEALYQTIIAEEERRKAEATQAFRKKAETYYRAFFNGNEPLVWSFTNEIKLSDVYLKFVNTGRYPYFLLSKRCPICSTFGDVKREIRSVRELGFALHDRPQCILHPSELS